MTEYTQYERDALDLLPYPLATAAMKCAAQNRALLHEIRLREGQYLSITSNGENFKCNIRCTKDNIDDVIRRLCGNSLYSHADTLREGYISYRNGIRAGVCGRAVTSGGMINAITDITSVNIRIPHRSRGAADAAYELIKKSNFSLGMLVYSRPGIGKTTLLREMIVRLAGGNSPHRVAVVDTRSELVAGVEESIMADILSAYPRGKGIEIAMRTLSPQFIVCDEISSDDDIASVLSAVGSGVHIIASAHAGSYEELMCRDCFRMLDEKNVFGIYIGLLGRDMATGGYKTEVSFKMTSDDRTHTGVVQR